MKTYWKATAAVVALTGALTLGALLSATPGHSQGKAPGKVPHLGNVGAAEPVQLSVSLTIIPGTSINEAPAFTVPARKVFVLEDLSGNAELPTGQKAIEVAVRLGDTPVRLTYASPVFLGPLTPTLDAFSWGRLARAYAEPGTVVSVFAGRTTNVGHADFQFTISGYFVNQ